MTTVAEAARAYAERGWKPVAVKRGDKKPLDRSWQKRAFNPSAFDGNTQNVAIQFGEPSGGLADVDLDCLEAIGLALDFLPDTQAIFGRNAKPASHMLYVSDLHKTEKAAAIAFKKYVDGKPGPVVVELRTGGNGKGALSVFPPSMHHGETVMWVRNGEPAKIGGSELKRAVLLLAIASVLAPAYPEPGSRHEAALVLGGVLARADFDASAIAHLMRILTRDACDEEANARIHDAVSALTLKAEGRELPGFPRLAEVWGKDVADTLSKWIQAERKSTVGPGGFEDSIALQFAELYSDDYRFVAKSSQWLHWNGGRWREEATYAAFDLSRGLCRGARPGDARAKTVNGVITLARTDRRIAATTDQWDRDPGICNTPTKEGKT
jgi:hypothetical protein